MKNLAINLRLLRSKKKMTQAQVSDALRLGERVLSHYENGAREPDNELLISLADFYGVTVDYLLRENKETREYENRVTRLKEKYLGKNLLHLVESSEIWKHYEQKINEVAKFNEEHKDDIELLLYEEMCDKADHIEQCDKADLLASTGHFYDARKEYEEMLSEGYYGAFFPLMSVCKEIMYMEEPEFCVDEVELYEYQLECIEKVLTYGAIARLELSSRIDSIFNFCNPVEEV